MNLGRIFNCFDVFVCNYSYMKLLVLGRIGGYLGSLEYKVIP